VCNAIAKTQGGSDGESIANGVVIDISSAGTSSSSAAFLLIVRGVERREFQIVRPGTAL